MGRTKWLIRVQEQTAHGRLRHGTLMQFSLNIIVFRFTGIQCFDVDHTGNFSSGAG